MQRILGLIENENASRIAIFSHIRGDGDCLGAQTGLAEVLTSAGLCVDMYNQEQLPENYSFLNGYQKISHANANSAVPDLCIAVDCASFERIGDLPETFKSCRWINIDHHVSNTHFGDLNIVDGEASSTCEVLSQMLIKADIDISAKAATNFYTGISTDTGSFMYSNASDITFSTAAFLMQHGANKNLVQKYIFENTSRKQLEIFKCLYSGINFLHNDEVAYATFSYESLAALNAVPADLEGVVSLIKQISGVELAILFSEIKKGQCKISMRTKECFDANKCCGVFGGGGHIRASGATLEGTFDECVNKVLDEVLVNWEAYANV